MKDLEDLVHEGVDMIDVRDVKERISELEFERACDICHGTGLVLTDDGESPNGMFWPCESCCNDLLLGIYNGNPPGVNVEWYEELDAELESLRMIEQEVPEGETLISENYFEEYARQLAEDIGAIDKDGKWPTNHIDWKAASEELMSDYSVVEYGAVTYYYRS